MSSLRWLVSRVTHSDASQGPFCRSAQTHAALSFGDRVGSNPRTALLSNYGRGGIELASLAPLRSLRSLRVEPTRCPASQSTWVRLTALRLRTGWDSNPRGRKPTRFPIVRLKPLGHPSRPQGAFRAPTAPSQATAGREQNTEGVGLTSHGSVVSFGCASLGSNESHNLTNVD